MLDYKYSLNPDSTIEREREREREIQQGGGEVISDGEARFGVEWMEGGGGRRGDLEEGEKEVKGTRGAVGMVCLENKAKGKCFSTTTGSLNTKYD